MRLWNVYLYNISKKKISYALPVLLLVWGVPSGPLSKWLSAHTSAPVFPNFNFFFPSGGISKLNHVTRTLTPLNHKPEEVWFGSEILKSWFSNHFLFSQNSKIGSPNYKCAHPKTKCYSIRQGFVDTDSDTDIVKISNSDMSKIEFSATDTDTPKHRSKLGHEFQMWVSVGLWYTV